jgi:hypothetical protein
MKTIRKVNIIPQYVDRVPIREEMEYGIFYIAEDFHCAGHLCLCGCGEETFITLQEGRWKLIKEKNGKISITPSLQNTFACRSHYIITNNVANFV